ncbi:hypothetical protein DPMN_104968 [Dreissena polymorpha]|uniref:Uncharacterized protein n=1 Tax=Dreissena polymorpha TaxID=45954 RepID=A0A9D4HAQ4_DREPO|nr:hypothetical protein DPMN_104968 [Dreissena polymorpha]
MRELAEKIRVFTETDPGVEINGISGRALVIRSGSVGSWCRDPCVNALVWKSMWKGPGNMISGRALVYVSGSVLGPWCRIRISGRALGSGPGGSGTVVVPLCRDRYPFIHPCGGEQVWDKLLAQGNSSGQGGIRTKDLSIPNPASYH